jgi:uncharacterized protein (DUF433 family)
VYLAWYNSTAIEEHMTLPDFLTTDDGGFIHLTGHRIGLHHIVRYYNEGYSPETLWEQFPTLSLALIHKVLGFYLENKDQVDDYCRKEEEAFEAIAEAAPSKFPLAELRKRLEAKRRAEAG